MEENKTQKLKLLRFKIKVYFVLHYLLLLLTLIFLVIFFVTNDGLSFPLSFVCFIFSLLFGIKEIDYKNEERYISCKK